MIEYRVLGRTGARVSPLCLGTDNFADPTPEDECVRMLGLAMDAGINLLDTGDVYAEGEGERIIGRELKRSGRECSNAHAPRKAFSTSLAWCVRKTSS